MLSSNEKHFVKINTIAEYQRILMLVQQIEIGYWKFKENIMIYV